MKSLFSFISSKKLCLIVLGCALFLRVAFVLFLGDRFVQPDEEGYHRLAMNIVNHHVFGSGDKPTAYYPPAYPFFLSLVYRVFGEKILWARLLQGLLSVLTVWLLSLYSIKRLGPGPGLITLILGSIYPYFLYYSGVLMSETMYLLLLVLGLIFLDQASDDPRRAVLFCGMAGLVWGINGLCRSQVIPFVMLLLGLSLLGNPLRIRPAFRCLVIFVVSFSLPLLFWAGRNFRQMGSATLDSHGGLNILIGTKYWEETYKDTEIALAAISRDYPQAVNMNEIERNNLWYGEAREWMKGNWQTYVSRIGKNLIAFWRLAPRTDRMVTSGNPFLGHSKRLFAYISFPWELGLIIFGAWGAWKSRPLWRKLLPLYALIFSHTLVHALSVSSIRYRLPVMLAFIVLAGHGLMHCLPRKIES